jgi:hypothetical protein
MSQELTYTNILQLATGFWASKTLLSAAELGIFTELAKGPLDCQTLTQRLGLHPRSAQDFFDTLVSLRMLERRDGIYSNTPETDLFLDRKKPSYIGGLLEMMNARLYPFWGSLTEGLRTGLPQNEAKHGGNFFESLYADPDRLRDFLRAMTGMSRGSVLALANAFPWHKYKTFVDLGTAQGDCAVQVALAHTHLDGIGFDLPPVQNVFEEHVIQSQLQDRLRFIAGDFFQQDLPTADVHILGHVLHDWNLQERQLLIRKSYEALPEDGSLIVYESFIDDDRRENILGLLTSLNMLIETPTGSNFTAAECTLWMQETGFRHIYQENLAGPESMVVGIK